MKKPAPARVSSRKAPMPRQMPSATANMPAMPTVTGGAEGMGGQGLIEALKRVASAQPPAKKMS